MTPRFLAKPLHCLRPILHIIYPKSMLSYSKRFTGSFRPVAGTRHLHRDYNFTELVAETVPRSLHIRAGRNLPDKEFRYLRTVILRPPFTAGFNSELLIPKDNKPPLLTFPAPGRCQALYFIFRFRKSHVFLLNSRLGPFICVPDCYPSGRPFSRSYRSNLP